jgi:ribose transport system substrate-binding protein
MNLKARTPITLSLASCALAGLLLAGCGNTGGSGTTTATSGTATPGGSPSAGGQTMLAFVTNNPSDYWIICQKGTEAAAKDLKDVNVQFVMPGDGTADTQKRDVDDLLAKGVKGIAISPVNPADQTSYLNNVASKTNLITSDSDAPNSNRLCYIGTDNEKAGEMAGDLIKKALPQGGKIALFVGKIDAQNAHDRIAGIQKAIQGTKIQIIDTRTDDADHTRAVSNVSDELVAHPDIAGLVGIWSYNGPAIYNAVKKAGKVGKIQIIAFDQEDQTMKGIHAKAIFGTVVQDPYTFGYNSIKLLDQLAKGDKSGIPANKLEIVPTQEITPTNIDAYEADYKKKLAGG